MAKELRGSDAGRCAYPHHCIEGDGSGDVLFNILDQSLAIDVRLEVGVLVHLTSGQPSHLSNGGQVNVGVVEHKQIHGAALLHALLAQLIVGRSLRCEHSFLLIGAQQFSIVAILQLARSLRNGQRGVEHQQLAGCIRSLQSLQTSLNGGIQNRFRFLGVRKHARYLLHQSIDYSCRFLRVTEEAIEQGHEHLLDITHHHHLRLGQAALDIVEMHGAVVRDKAHAHLELILPLIHRQMLEYVFDLGAQQVDQSRLDRIVRDIDNKDEGWNLGRSVVLKEKKSNV